MHSNPGMSRIQMTSTIHTIAIDTNRFIVLQRPRCFALLRFQFILQMNRSTDFERIYHASFSIGQNVLLIRLVSFTCKNLTISMPRATSALWSTGLPTISLQLDASVQCSIGFIPISTSSRVSNGKNTYHLNRQDETR